MNLPDYNSPSALKEILSSNSMAMQKKFGQNFLVNENARIKLIDALSLDSSSTVWEVGPGLGAMTSEILRRGALLKVFEIDKGFIALLKVFFKDEIKSGQMQIIEGDVLKTWKEVFKNSGFPSRFFSNLPYNIAASLFADFIEENVRFERGVITVQKEVAMRMTAKPKTADYSSFSVLCQWAYNIDYLMDLPGGNFWPKPNVDSRSVIFTKKEDFPLCENPKLFMKVQKALFSSRRKNIKNNLTGFLKDSKKAEEYILKSNLNLMSRAEELKIEDFLRLSDVINNGIIL